MWSCDGSPAYEMTDIEKSERGTDIILYVDDDNKEFLEEQRIETLLKNIVVSCLFPLCLEKNKNGKTGNMSIQTRIGSLMIWSLHGLGSRQI